MTSNADSTTTLEKSPPIVWVLICLLICISFVAMPTLALADRPPNIVVILADDLGCCDMALYDGWVKTPRIEQMARQGMLFTDFHTNSSVCSPTRAAFLTGRYQQRVGIVDVIVGSREPNSGISPSVRTLPRVFKDAGYATALFGKWHCGYQDKYNPVHHGFDEFVGFLNGATDYHRHGAWRVGLERKNVRGYSTQIITDRSVDFIQRNKNRPFFLYVSHAAVHNPYQTAEDTPDKRIKGENPNRINDKNRAKYKWMLEDLDKGVGQVLDTLNELDLAENTLVMFFSDNGAVGMSPREFRKLRGGKFSHYEGGHRVPAVAWWPGKIKAGGRSDKFIVGFDLFPTFTEVAGLSKSNPGNLDGASFKAHLLEQKKLPGQGHLLRVRTEAWDGDAARRLENDRKERESPTLQPPEGSTRVQRRGSSASGNSQVHEDCDRALQDRCNAWLIAIEAGNLRVAPTPQGPLFISAASCRRSRTQRVSRRS